MERGQDSESGAQHMPQDQRGQQVPLSYPQPHQREATAGLWPFQHKRHRVLHGESTMSLAPAAVTQQPPPWEPLSLNALHSPGD